MAKLNQLILLENMMRTYDAMNIKDANLTHFQGVCTEKLVDEIIGRLSAQRNRPYCALKG